MERIIKNYLEGKATETEQKQLLGWLRNAHNRIAFNRIKSDWKKSLKEGIFPGGGRESWSRLQAGLWQKEYDKRQHARKVHLGFRIAAVFFFLISIGSFVNFFMDKEQPDTELFTNVIAENGQISKVNLPDGSVVWLNSGSQLSYSNLYAARHRNIRLTGEAFIDAAKNEQLPMVVEVGNLSVKVLGTRFNVNGYDSENSVEVVLEEGLVELLRAGRHDVFHRMNSGERAKVDLVNNQFSAGKVNPARYTSWTKGIINIYNLPMEEVVKQLEKRYNQQFELDPEVKEIRYTFTIQNESLDEILKLMEKITPINIVQNENKIRIRKNRKIRKDQEG